jgi:O-antigen/teichoic acid export membrane protein
MKMGSTNPLLWAVTHMESPLQTQRLKNSPSNWVKICRSALSKLPRRKMSSELGWVISGQLVALLGNFASVKFLTVALGPSAYGELALGVTVASILNMFIYGPISQSILRFLPVAIEEKSLPTYIHLIKKVNIILSAFLAMAAIIMGSAVAYVVGGNWANLATLGVLFGIANGINSAFRSFQTAVRARKSAAIFQSLDVWLRLGFALAAAALINATGSWALAGYLAGGIIICVGQFVLAKQSAQLMGHWSAIPVSRPLHAEAKQRVLAYSAPFVIWAVFSTFSLFTDRWVLQALFGEREVGIYVALSQIASLPGVLLTGIITQYAVPLMFASAGSLKQRTGIDNSLKILMSIIFVIVITTIPTVAFAYCFGQNIVDLLASSEFSGRAQLLWVLVAANLIFQIGQTAALVGQILRRPDRFLPTFMVNAGATLILSVIFGKLYGVTGVAAAALISNSMYLISVLYTANNTVRENHSIEISAITAGEIGSV